MSFMDACLKGKAKLKEIDVYVERWHSAEHVSQPLAQYLGLTQREFLDWVTNPDSLIKLFFEKKMQMNQALRTL